MAQRSYEHLMNELPMGYADHKIILDENNRPCDYEFLEVNDAFENLTGLKGSDIIGKRVSEVLPDIKKSAFNWIKNYGNLAINGGSEEFEQYAEPLKRWYKIKAYSPEKGRFVTAFSDITEQKKIEKDSRAKGQALEAMNKELKDRVAALEESVLRFKIAAEGTETGIWDWDMIKNEIMFSSQWKAMLGYEDHEVENSISGWKKLWHPHDANKIEKAFKDHLAGKTQKYEIIHRCRHKDGSWRWIVTRGTLLRDGQGSPYRWVGTHVDVTEIKAIEDQLFQEKDQFKTTLLSVGDGIISTDVKGKVLILNPVAEQLTGWLQEAAVGKSIDEVFSIVHETTRQRCENLVQKVIDTGKIVEGKDQILLLSKDGFERPIENTGAPIKDEQGNVTGVVLAFRDFTEKKKNQDEITYLSYHDHLTGLYNRCFFETELKRLDTKRNLPMTIIMGDVNGLKLINDSFGHFVGDELLIKIGQMLKNSFRDDDIIARLGGDEYAILLAKTDEIEAQRLIDRALESIKKDQLRGLEMSVSFGWATKNHMDQTLDFVMKKAEDRMYNKKLFEGPSVRERVIEGIVATLNAKSPTEQAHSERVSELCVAMGKALSLESGEIKTLKALGLLHDIGRIAIPDHILNKRDLLTEKEYKEIKRHSEIGFRILSTANGMAEIADYVLAHHERWDGKGYPKGLAGRSIPLPARICAIADAYDAMTNFRSYQPVVTPEVAAQELKKKAGKQFDGQLVDVFLKSVFPTLANPLS
jgi:diguanylate cyclase (GGDEF)-like protein/PAS domain S-box-containing protein